MITVRVCLPGFRGSNNRKYPSATAGYRSPGESPKSVNREGSGTRKVKPPDWLWARKAKRSFTSTPSITAFKEMSGASGMSLLTSHRICSRSLSQGRTDRVRPQILWRETNIHTTQRDEDRLASRHLTCSVNNAPKGSCKKPDVSPLVSIAKAPFGFEGWVCRDWLSNQPAATILLTNSLYVLPIVFFLLGQVRQSLCIPERLLTYAEIAPKTMKTKTNTAATQKLSLFL